MPPAQKVLETEELIVLPVTIVFVMLTVASCTNVYSCTSSGLILLRNFRHCCCLLCCR